MASRRVLAAIDRASRPWGRPSSCNRTSHLCRRWLTEEHTVSRGQPAQLSQYYFSFAARDQLHASVGYKSKGDVYQGVLTLDVPTSAMWQCRRTFAAAPDAPHKIIGMPSLSPTMQQGNIVKWHKKEGDKLQAGDVLAEIETDKATLEMENQEEGYLAKILLGDGSKEVPVGRAIAILAEEEEDIPKFANYQPEDSAGAAPSSPPPPPPAASAPPPPPPTPAAATPAAPPPPRPAPAAGGRVLATPAAKLLAEEKGVDLSGIKGTGFDGSIVKADIEDYLASGPPRAGGVPVAYEGVDFTDLPHSQIRKITASRLLVSKQTIPHYYLTIEANVDKLIKLRAQLNAVQDAAKGKKLSINDFVIKAAALALKKVPDVNATWTDEFIRRYHNIDISIAVQTEAGLMVPIVKDADKKGISAISEEVKRLAGKARENKLSPAEFQGGTFTISNLGMYGIKQFCAIINPPQACILAVGTTEKRIVPSATSEKGYEPATFLVSTLSCDHRVVDGAVGAQWLAAYKAYLEDPVTMLL